MYERTKETNKQTTKEDIKNTEYGRRTSRKGMVLISNLKRGFAMFNKDDGVTGENDNGRMR